MINLQLWCKSHIEFPQEHLQIAEPMLWIENELKTIALLISTKS